MGICGRFATLAQRVDVCIMGFAWGGDVDVQRGVSAKKAAARS